MARNVPRCGAAATSAAGPRRGFPRQPMRARQRFAMRTSLAVLDAVASRAHFSAFSMPAKDITSSGDATTRLGAATSPRSALPFGGTAMNRHWRGNWTDFGPGLLLLVGLALCDSAAPAAAQKVEASD